MELNKEQLGELYRNWILPEARKPYGFEMGTGSQSIKAYNPYCGDQYLLRYDAESKLRNLTFSGNGCDLSKASTSLLLQTIEGLTMQEARVKIRKFLEDLDQTGKSGENWDGALKFLVELPGFEGRIDCIKLSWEAFLQSEGVKPI